MLGFLFYTHPETKRLRNYKLDHAITATQKTILGAFGIDKNMAKIKALIIGKELMNAAVPEENNNGEDEIYELC